MEKVINSTYLINLDSRPDRLKHSNQQLTNNGFTYKRFPAISGKDLSYSFLKNVVSENVLNKIDDIYRTEHYQLTRGGIGCALSHISLWNTLVNSNYEYALIFEDDIVFEDSSVYFFFKNLLTLQKKQNVYYNTLDLCLKKMNDMNILWDILLLQIMIPDQLDTIKFQSIPLFSVNTDKTYYVFKNNVFWGLGGYFITKKCASKLLSNLSDLFPLREQIDFYLSKKSLQNYITIYSIQPNILNQYKLLFTDIQNSCPKCDINIEIKPYINDSNIISKTKKQGNTILLYIAIVLCITIFYLVI